MPSIAFYRAMLYAERGKKSSFRPSVCPSMTLRYRCHIGWNCFESLGVL